MTLAMIDQPSPLATLAKWEQHLDRVRALPDNATNKPRLLREAEEMVAEKRRGG
jgi:hypothetical protein